MQVVEMDRAWQRPERGNRDTSRSSDLSLRAARGRDQDPCIPRAGHDRQSETGAYMNEVMVDVPCKRYGWMRSGPTSTRKLRTSLSEKLGEAGDVWTQVALDADTKLVPSFLVGGHGPTEAHQFMTDVAGRMANRVLLSSDGNRTYLTIIAYSMSEPKALSTALQPAQVHRHRAFRAHGRSRPRPYLHQL